MNLETEDEMDNSEIPDWHKEVIRQRLKDYENDPRTAIDLEDAMEEIEKGL